MPDANPASLTSNSRLAVNSLWNIFGQVLPLLAGLVTVPILIRELGTDRMGILSLTWMIVGYFNLFDMGIGRALTMYVARMIGSGEGDRIPRLIWTALTLMLGLGLVGLGLLLVLAHWLVFQVLNVPADLQTETFAAIRLLAISVPLVISIAGLRGVLEAYQRFDLVNYIRIPGSLFTFLAPVLVLPFSHDLVHIMAALVAGRVVVLLVHLGMCRRLVGGFLAGVGFGSELVPPLLRISSWMLISNLVSPLMVYLDRFLIGAVATMTAVAYYTTPYDVVTKLSVVPIALVGVLFPAFSMLLQSDEEKSLRVFGAGINLITLIMFPTTLVIFTFAPELLGLWLNPEFARHSTPVLRLLAVGVFLNSLARVPFVLAQGAGRPDLPAKLHLVELPLYLALVFVLVRLQGINGAALAWTLRMLFDLVALFLVARKLYAGVHGALVRAGVTTGLFLLACLGSFLTRDITPRSVLLAAMLATLGAAAWKWLVGRPEKEFLGRVLGRDST